MPTFDELSERAKERAREHVRGGNQNHDWWEYIYEDADKCATILGIRISTRTSPLSHGGSREDLNLFFSGFGRQGSGACWLGIYNFAPDACKAIREHAPQDAELHRIADELYLLQVTFKLTLGTYLAASVRSIGNGSHSTTMAVEVTREDTGDEPDEFDPRLPTLMRDFADWVYSQLEAEDEYLNSDECVDEQIHSNGYRFDEDGSII